MRDQDDIPKSEIHRAVQELYYWQRRDDASNFTALLYRLISKADIVNSARLELAFPSEFMAFTLWQDAPNEEEFFKHWLGRDLTMMKRAP